ncbi:MAG: InlB B-repeat-containing protein [Treponema sp.]|nr:InlB B-repeat-containing protein [Candidatus Treponema merdequi]
MKKLWNGIARVLCVMAVCVIAGCSYAGDGGSTPPVIPVTFTITYDSNGHGKSLENKRVNPGYELTAEDLPELTEDYFYFGGWQNGGKIIESGFTVTENITLTAKWTEWGKPFHRHSA